MFKDIPINNIPYSTLSIGDQGRKVFASEPQNQDQVPTLSFTRFLSLGRLPNLSKLFIIKAVSQSGSESGNRRHTQRVKLSKV